MGIDLKVSILCGDERDGWINPALCWATHVWANDPRVSRCEMFRAQGYRTSQEARNAIVEDFRQSGCEWLLMVDNDVRPELAGQFLNLVDLAFQRPGPPAVHFNADEVGGEPTPADYPKIVAAAVPIHQAGSLYVNAYHRQLNGLYRSLTHGEFQKALKERGGLLECDAVGTGAIMIHGDVIRELAESDWLPDWLLREWTGWLATAEYQYLDGPCVKAGSKLPVFLRPRNLAGKTLLGEDLLFCERAAHLGYKSYSSLHHLCGHFHTHDEREIPEVEVAAKPLPTAADFGIPEPIPEVTAYSITPGIASFLREIIEKRGVQNVLELGSGVSTLVLIDAVGAGGKVTTVEEDERYAERLCECLGISGGGAPIRHEVVKNRLVSQVGVSVLHRPLDRELLIHGSHKWYSEFEDLVRPQVDLLFIDGPSADNDYRVRLPAPYVLRSLLRRGAAMVLDDAGREGERDCLKYWQSDGLVEDVVVHEISGRQVASMRFRVLGLS